MANTYKALSTVTVGAGGAANISFTNIPQTYTDLKIVYSLRNTRNNPTDSVSITLNSISSGSAISARGNGSSTTGYTSTTLIAGRCTSATATANVFGNGEIYINNYASNSLNKPLSVDMVTENNVTEAFQEIIANLFSNTTPITSLTIFGDNGNLVQYSTVTLYGVFNADVSSAPATPTIGTATATGPSTATVAFTGVSNAASYTATSTPGSITATGTTSPLTVTGLTPATSYTFKVKSNNPFGSSAESAASNSITTENAAFESIATVTVGSGGASNVEFTSIPNTYTHLQIRAIHRSTATTAGAFYSISCRFNADTGNNYAWHYVVGTGSAANAVNGINFSSMYLGTCTSDGISANIYSTGTIDILDYANTNKNTTATALSGTDSNGTGETFLMSGLWNNTSAVNSITLFPTGGNWKQYTQFALYGIKAA